MYKDTSSVLIFFFEAYKSLSAWNYSCTSSFCGICDSACASTLKFIQPSCRRRSVLFYYMQFLFHATIATTPLSCMQIDTSVDKFSLCQRALFCLYFIFIAFNSSHIFLLVHSLLQRPQLTGARLIKCNQNKY